MRTRSQGLPLIELDPDINITCRNLRKQKQEELVRMATQEQIQALMEQIKQLKDAQAAVDAQKQPPINEAFVPTYCYHEPPRVNVNNFELKTGLINMVQQNQYGGQAIEDPNAHLAHFLELCSTIKMNGVPDDYIRLRLFPFSLRDKAKSWYHALQLGDAISWEDMAHAFLRKFHPPGLTLKLKMDIVRFEQFEDEKLAETWERYQEKLRMCPSHGFDTGTLVIMFYNACGEQTRMHMDTAAGGSLLQKGSSEAWDIIESIAATSYQWPSERVQLKKVAAVSGSDSIAALATHMAELTAKISELTVRKTEPSIKDPSLEDANFVNGRGYENFQQVQPGMYNRGPQFQSGQRQFQPGGRPHPNLSYSNPNNALQPPPGFSVSSGGVINEPKKDGLEEMMKQVLVKMTGMETNIGNKISNIEQNFSALSKQVQMLETQVGQMANQAAAQHQPGQFPSNTQINPKSQPQPPQQNQQCHAIHVIDESVEDEDISMSPPLPFPRPSLDEQSSNFLETFKKLAVNIPFVEMLRSKPKDVQIVKAVMEKKSAFNEFEEVLAVKEYLLPPKREDPGSFNIPVKIGKSLFERVLCDTGASINVMPLKIYRKLQLGDLKPTNKKIQLIDKSCSKPLGIAEDVLVKVSDFFFPVDFVVLDIPEDPKMPMLLGRPFLATCGAKLDMQRGTMTLGAYGETVIFKKPPPKEFPQLEVINLADSFLEKSDDEEVEENELPKYESKERTPKPKEVLKFETCLFLEHDGGLLTPRNPKKKKVKFRIFRNKNEKGAMLVEDVRAKRSVFVEMAPKSRKVFQWLECCFRPP